MLLGKRSALLDVTTRDGDARLHELMSEADVLVFGYRPSTVDHLGLSEAGLIERHPGLVIVYLDAWGHTGPWASAAASTASSKRRPASPRANPLTARSPERSPASCSTTAPATWP